MNVYTQTTKKNIIYSIHIPLKFNFLTIKYIITVIFHILSLFHKLKGYYIGHWYSSVYRSMKCRGVGEGGYGMSDNKLRQWKAWGLRIGIIRLKYSFTD